MEDTNVVISSSWVGESRYLVSFRSLKRMSYAKLAERSRNSGTRVNISVPLVQPFLTAQILTTKLRKI